MKKLGDVADDVFGVPDSVLGDIVECTTCGTPGTWNRPGGRRGLCEACSLAKDVEEDSRIPKAKALFHMGVPARYRTDPDWIREPLQFDPCWPSPASVLDWAAAAVEGGPWCLTLSGVNGSGKSVIAAEILARLWRIGYRPGMTDGGTPLPMWIGEMELADEDRMMGFGEPRHMRLAALRQPVMVWDDLGSSGAWKLVFSLIEGRHAAGMLSIFTTHRPLSAAKAEALGVPGSSIEESAPEIYSRLRDGWIGRWAAKSYRGTRQEVPA